MSAAPPHRDAIGRVWACGFAAGLLLVATGATDPCSPGLAQLPFLSPPELARCGAAPGLAWFLLLDLVLIAAYTAFFLTATAWGARHLTGLGPFLDRFGRTLAVSPAVADLVENALLWFGGPALLVRVASTAKWLLLAVALGLALWALLIGTARFLLPWSQPPQFPPDVPDGEVGEPWPCVEGSWFRSPDGEFPGVAYGIGLSGGGIRSAAFSSGVLQALAGTAWSPSKAQYLATVSGGGYVGVSSQGLRHPLADPLDPDPYAEGAPETARIRRHARYLSHSWPGLGRLLLAATAGWVINAALVVGPLAWVGAVLALVPGLTPADRGAASVDLVVLGCAVGGLVVAAVLWQLTSAETALDERVKRAASPLRVPSAVLVLAGCLLVVVGVPFGSWWLLVPVGLAVLGFVVRLAAVRWESAPAQTVSAGLFDSGWVTAALFVVGAFADGTPGNPTTFAAWLADPGWQVALVGSAIALVLAFRLLEQTWWSPHPMYKARIASTFALQRGPGPAEASPLDPETWSYLDEWGLPAPSGPQLLVCATANVEDISIKPKGTRAVPFVFAHDYVGSPELGWWTTADFRRCLGRRLAGDGTLQAATAISGAAVASGLGVAGRIPTAGTAMALANLRLGVWLPNPRAVGVTWPTAGRAAERARMRGPAWLWREVSGFLPSARRFVYVSDGGHLDNLGLMELLRRRCAVILLVDASNDRLGTTRALDGVLRIASEHLGVACERAPSPVNRAGAWEAVRAAADCVEVFAVTHPDGRRTTVVYAKARFADTLRDDPDVRELAADVAKAGRAWWPWSLGSLPRTGTGNQWLTDAQFAGYVRLGRAVGAQALARLK
jgi:hypothetical protein